MEAVCGESEEVSPSSDVIKARVEFMVGFYSLQVFKLSQSFSLDYAFFQLGTRRSRHISILCWWT